MTPVPASETPAMTAGANAFTCVSDQKVLPGRTGPGLRGGDCGGVVGGAVWRLEGRLRTRQLGALQRRPVRCATERR